MIPALDAHGLLPAGEFACTLDEIEAAYCFNAHRSALLADFRRFLSTEWYPLALGFSVFVDGSFVRSKPLPSDIDIVIDVPHGIAAQAMGPALALRFDAPRLKHEYHVDLWLRHPSIPNDLVAYFQYIGLKAAAELQLAPTHPKGILRLQP